MPYIYLLHLSTFRIIQYQRGSLIRTMWGEQKGFVLAPVTGNDGAASGMCMFSQPKINSAI